MSDPTLHFIRDGIHTHLALPAEVLLQAVPRATQICFSEWLESIQCQQQVLWT